MAHVSMESIEYARATARRRSLYAQLFIGLAIVSAVAGFFKWDSTKPDLNAAAGNVISALATATGSTGPQHYAHSEPIWLYLGFGLGAVFLVIALILLATRPHAPARAWTDARA